MLGGGDKKLQNQIIWYDRRNSKWEISASRLKVGRTSATCTLIRSEKGNKIIIAGGLMVDFNKKASKSC